jgi:hypothetical protein
MRDRTLVVIVVPAAALRVREFGFHGLSGYSWYVYRRADRPGGT